ncbi:MAG: F0F1 ATP synthase subunit A [Spirochaetota bacterium]|nr:F0F1 ATP synthase subunit A [Spirochaetota bacterium]
MIGFLQSASVELAKGEKEPLMDILIHHIFDSGEIKLFNLFGLQISITKHVLVMWIVAVILILAVILTARAVKKDKSATGGRFSVLIQLFLDFIHNDIVKPNFDHSAKKFLPFFCTMFFFIMLCNLLGLIPYSSTVTGNIAVTMSLAIVTFVFTQIYGMMKQGILKYWIHLVPSGIPKMLWPLMFVIEFVGLFTKPFALTIRLFANMIAGHIVILVLLYLATTATGWVSQTGVGIAGGVAAVGVNLLEVFIALLQAYIFTFLSAIFISAAGEGH